MRTDQQTADVSRAGWNAWDRGLALALAAILVIAYLATLSNQLGTVGGDSARYLMLADALRGGHGYVETDRAGTPPHRLYPPLLPAMLAPLRALDPEGFLLPHLLIVASLFAAMAGLYWLLRDTVGHRMALLAVFLAASMPVVLRSSLSILSELPFMAWTLLSLAAWQRHARSGRALSPMLLVALGCAAAAFLTRTAGVALILAYLAAGVVRLRHGLRPHGIALGAMAGILLAPVVGWSLWTNQGDGDRAGYVEQLTMKDPYQPALGKIGVSGLVERARGRGRAFAVRVPSLYFEGFGSGGLLRQIGFAAFGLLFVLGIFHAAVHRRLWQLYALTYLAMILVWPWSGERFVLPILPLVCAVLVGGASTLAKVLAVAPQRLAVGVSLVPVCVLLAASAPGWFSFYRVLATDLDYLPRAPLAKSTSFSSFYDAQLWMSGGERMARVAVEAWGEYLAVGHWLRERDAACVLACRNPRVMALDARIPTQPIPLPADPDRYLHEMRRKGVRYVLSQHGAFKPGPKLRALAQTRAARPAAFQTLLKLNHVELLRLDPAGAASASDVQ